MNLKDLPNEELVSRMLSNYVSYIRLCQLEIENDKYINQFEELKEELLRRLNEKKEEK